MREFLRSLESLGASLLMKTRLTQHVPIGRASMTVTHRRPTDFKIDAKTGIFVPVLESFKMVDAPETVWNVITNSGRDFLHNQGYGTTGLGANGLNFIGLSDDSLTETSASTTLSNEITTNGLGRAQGTVNHSAGTNTTTIERTFTASGTQSARKAALFTAVSSGIMNHALSFTQRSLINGDTLQITFTITLG